MSLFTEGDLENYMLEDINATYGSWVTAVIQAVTDYIEKYTGIDFENSTSSNKYYDGSATNELVIDDCQSISAIQVYDIDGTVIYNLTENTDYWLYPLNESVKNMIVLKKTGQIAVFPEYDRAVKVTAVWGYSSCPTPIKIAGIKMASKILEKGLKGGEANSETLGEYTIDYKEVDEQAEAMGIKNILDMYRIVRL